MPLCFVADGGYGADAVELEVIEEGVHAGMIEITVFEDHPANVPEPLTMAQVYISPTTARDLAHALSRLADSGSKT